MSARRLRLYLFALALLGAMLACNLPQNIPAASTQATAPPPPSPTAILSFPSPGPSPTAMPMPTSPAAAAASPTPVPVTATSTPLAPSPAASPTGQPASATPLPTQTPTASSVLSAPTPSSTQVYYNNNACGPRQLTLSVVVSDPQVYSVFLFVRLKEKSSGDKTDWNDGIPMSAQGNGTFQTTLLTQDIPGYAAYAEAWLQYQFVATDAQQNNLARSPVYAETITLSKCP